VALPDGCELTDSHLVFWELATAAQLADVDAHYERCCFVACTNGLRPLGPVEILAQPIPELAPGTAVLWGNRSLTAEAAVTYRTQGFVLCEFRLPVQGMGAPVPPDIPLERPASTM
jgi:hypothetical protein